MKKEHSEDEPDDTVVPGKHSSSSAKAAFPQWNIRHIRHLYTALSGTLDTLHTCIPTLVEH